MKIGLSLSFCVQDIVKGKVRLDEVLCIITGTKATTEAEREAVLTDYCRTYWRGHEESALAVMKELAPRLIQPRIYGVTPPSIAGGHWIDVSDRYPAEES